MKLECTFEELDWQGKIVKRKQTFTHPFNVDPDLLLKASIEGNSDCLPEPNNYNITFFDELGLSKHRINSWKKGIAKFKRWHLIVSLVDKHISFDWKMV